MTTRGHNLPGVVYRLLVGFSLLMSITLASGQQNVRPVKFENFSYPWTPSSSWPSQLVWVDPSAKERVTLVKGRYRLHSEGESSDAPFSGLTLEEVRYGSVTGTKEQDAIVVLRYDTGGTQYSHYVYIYSLAARTPELLACFHAGDRAYSGLYKVYAESGKLIVELFDPEKRTGDCCSSGLIRTRYEWRNAQFIATGAREYGTPKAPSRLPVDMFGMHR
jgi:hypothetical protein